jgi:hypothetical protein
VLASGLWDMSNVVTTISPEDDALVGQELKAARHVPVEVFDGEFLATDLCSAVSHPASLRG